MGGFYIITHMERFKYLNQRLSAQMVVLNSVVVGIFLLLTSYIICFAAAHFASDYISFIKSNFFPLDIDYFGTAVLAFLLGIVISSIGNLITNEDKELARAIERIGNELELIFKDSCDSSVPLIISLKSGKVYIGYVEYLSKPQDPGSTYVKIVPLSSGYRDEKKNFHITTNYSTIYATYIAEGKINKIEDLNLQIVILVSEIISAARFDPEVFEKFTRRKKTKGRKGHHEKIGAGKPAIKITPINPDQADGTNTRNTDPSPKSIDNTN